MSNKPRFKTVETETSWDVIDVINGGRYGSWRNFSDAEQDRLTREAAHRAKIANEASDT